MAYIGTDEGHTPIVLVVDDDAVDRGVNVQALTDLGYATLEAGTAEEALRQARLHDTDIVVSEYSLPDMDGLSLMRNLAMVAPESTTIIMTATGSQELAVRALKAGARDYILKGMAMENQLRTSVRAAWRELSAERVLRKSTQQHEAMIRALPDAVLRVDESGAVLQQGSVPVMPRSSVSEAHEATLMGIFGLDAGQRLLQVARAALKDGDTKRCQFSQQEGEVRLHYEANLAPCGGREVVLVIRDVTETLAGHQRLREALEAAKSASRAKSVFLANMSHEIRTPMNGVLGMAQLLLESQLTREQTEQVSLIMESSRTLLQIIDDILDTSKVEAGKLELEQIAFCAPELFERACATLATAVRASGNELHLHLDPSVPQLMMGDPTRILQVLLNYLSNANKFTQSGRIDMHVTCEEAPEGAVVRCVVQDTGVGIPADKLSRLFVPFSQVDASTRRRHGGTGLGLALSRELVQLMNGEVGVSSEPGVGSRFWFTIPCIRAESVPEPVEKRTSRPVDRLRVLVAEDNVINQKVTGRMLQGLGHEVVVVKDGREAVAAVMEGGFDVVLMDCHMPEVDGYQATQQIRALSHVSRAIPIIALTASATAEDRALAEIAGMDDFLSKPLMRADLVRVLARFESQPEASKRALG